MRLLKSAYRKVRAARVGVGYGAATALGAAVVVLSTVTSLLPFPVPHWLFWEWRANACLLLGIAIVIAGVVWNRFDGLRNQLAQVGRDTNTMAEALRRSQAEMDARVQRRTAELAALVTDLETEIAARKKAEEEERRIQERFEMAVSGSRDGLWDWDLRTNEFYFSPRWKSMLGYEEDEISNCMESFIELLYPADRARATTTVQEHLAGRTSEYEVELRMRHKDGSFRWILTRGVALRDAHGVPYRMAGCHTDVTERKRTEESLQLAMAGARCLIWQAVVELRDGDLVWDIRIQNEETAQQFLPLKSDGHSSYTELWRQSRVPADRSKSRSLSRHAITNGLTGYVQAFRCIREDGEIRWLHEDVHIEAIGAGRYHLTGVCTDITERKEAEEELREQREFLRDVIDAAPNLIFVKDWNGTFRLVNKAMAAAYGTTVDGLEGKTDADFNSDADQVRKFLEDDRRVMRKREELVVPEEQLTLASGETRWMQAVKRPLVSGDGETAYLLGIATDITERKKNEQAILEAETQLVQSAKLASLGTLAAGVAHELNQPVAIIRGITQQLQDMDELDAEVRDDLKLVEGQTSRMMKIINHLRTFCRSSSPSLERVNVNEIIENCFILVGVQLKEHNVEISLDLADPAPAVLGDANELEQVLLNLITNARDALQGCDGAKVSLRTSDEDGFTVLEFRDNGPGVPEKLVQHIFDPFFTTKEPGKGTGLGLSISQSIIRKHKGTLEVRNEGGAVFRIRIPAYTANETEREPLAA
jgi:two-component system, cell cycle sensor histidine kinase and response regulator CckA